MSYNNRIQPLYSSLLGTVLKQQLKEKGILQNQVGYEEADGELNLLSETTVGQILKGKRNMSSTAALAFQTTLNYQTPKKLFFPNIEFEFQLIFQLITLILTDDIFKNSEFQKVLASKLDSSQNSLSYKINLFLEHHQEELLSSFSHFIPDFPKEETSYEIAEKVSDWLSEFACLLSQI